jgi:hypothetical protein
MATQRMQDQKQEVPASIRNELKAHWALILVLFIMQVFAFGFPTFALPFVYSGATEEFGWTRQQAVLLVSFKFYVSAVAALAVGRVLDSINPRLSILGIVCCYVFLALSISLGIYRDRCFDDVPVRDDGGNRPWWPDRHRSGTAETPLWSSEPGA